MTRPIARTRSEGDGQVAALERGRKHVRGLISPRLEMKFMPELRFRLDTAPDYAGRIDEMLKDPVVRCALDSAEK